jgi:hypothetical protein
MTTAIQQDYRIMTKYSIRFFGAASALTAGILLAGVLAFGFPKQEAAPSVGSPAKAAATKDAKSVATRPAHSKAVAKAATPQLSSLTILPNSIHLSGPNAVQRVVVEGTFSDGHQEDLTDKAKLSAFSSDIAHVSENGFVAPVADGKTTLRAAVGALQATAMVVVKGATAPFEWSFRNHVLPVMTKMGCNSGACHGALAGKGGFKLTLRGYDPDLDYQTMTRGALARRTVRMEPARSLILLKPTLAVAHGGGRRFPVESPEYKVMSEWIAAGMPAPQASDPRIQSLEVLPREIPLAPGAEQQILVTARFSDGHSEDVTRWTKYSSTDESVASVDDAGRVKMRGHGEAAITIYYLGLVSFARLRVPFPAEIDAQVFRTARSNNYIDALVLKKLEQLRIPPSGNSTDADFIRRAYLDAAGILPTPAEVESFFAGKSPDKRTKLIDRILERPEFVDYWAYKWSDLLLVSSRRLSKTDMWTYYNWIRESVAANKPWDQFVREVITASGNARENGAVNYYLIHREPIDIVENTTQAFMGTSITCARCHNHPLEKWTQMDYYGMLNQFARVRIKTASGQRVGGVFEEASVYSSPTGEINHPRLGRPMPPKPLDAPALALDSPEDRREYYAQWLTSRENPYFARAIVNRVWKNFMGRGLVEAVDDLRMTNPSSNDELFNAVVVDFKDSGFDVKKLIRTIMLSATYQASSRPNEQNAQDEKYFSHYFLRRLPAEVLLDALSQVTQSPQPFKGFPLGMRAMQLPDVQVDSYFLTAFGRPSREQTRESERTAEPSITQALHIINGDTLNAKLRAPDGTVAMLMKLGLSDERTVEYLFLSAFGRLPNEEERSTMTSALRSAREEKLAGGAPNDPYREALEDMLWAMVTSKEFIFNH